MNIVIKNSNNNILLKKGKKNFGTLPKTHCSRLGLNLRPSIFLPTYLTTSHALTISAIRLFVYFDVFLCIYSEV